MFEDPPLGVGNDLFKRRLGPLPATLDDLFFESLEKCSSKKPFFS